MTPARWTILLVAFTLATSFAEDSVFPDTWARDQLVAWCIVPFDAKKRGPEERAQMLKRLGVTRSAYDWRANHVPTFEEEIQAYQRHGIEMFAFWAGHEEAFRLFEKYKITPQIWKTAPSPKGQSEEEKVAQSVANLEALVARSKELGCKFGLYNHGGWGGQPENLVAVCEAFRAKGDSHVGIVYNFHHAHERIATWESDLEVMKPYLWCLNLNGMIPGGDKEGKKILTLGMGSHEKEMLGVVIRSEYQGPIGILDHRNETDTEETLRENLAGWEQIQGSLKTSAGKAE